MDVNAQSNARWLEQKVKELPQGNSPADVLEELAKKHKFTLAVADDTVRSELETGKLYGHINGVSTKQLVAAMSHLTYSDGQLPWTVDKSNLRFLNPTEIVTVAHDVRTLSSLTVDRDQFLQAVTNSVDGVSDVEETDESPETGSMLELTPTAMTVRQTNRRQARLYELLAHLKQEVDQRTGTTAKASENKVLRTLEKETAIGPIKLPVLEFFSKLLTDNRIPWLLMARDDSSLDLEAITEIAKGKYRIIDVVENAATELDLTVDLIDGILVMTIMDEESGPVRPRVYNIQRLLKNSTPKDIADEIMGLENVSTEWTEILGPLLIIQADFNSHRKIQAAIDGEPARTEQEALIVHVNRKTKSMARQDNADTPETVGSTTSSSSVKLLSPAPGAKLLNGDYTRALEHEWAFDWADVPRATKYHLFVKATKAKIPIVDRDDILQSEWKEIRRGVVGDSFLQDWGWKVRAFVDGEWTEWSDVRTFDVRAARRVPNTRP